MEKIISLGVIPKKKFLITLHAFKWFFFLVFLFIFIAIILLLLIGKIYTQMILTYSITGFFTFFTGYFGWIFARGVMDALSKNEDKLKKSIPFRVSEVDE